MAQLALGIAGSVIGGMIAPGIGASIGWAVGSMLGSALFPQQIEGPRLSDLKVHTSSYGGMNPLLYGTMRLPGNVIWTTDLVEHAHESSGKGGPEVTTYSYTVSCAIRFCEGPVDGINRIWANGRVIYDPAGDVGSDLPITIYLGTETQLPDPTMEADLGAGNVPAHRGVVYIVLTDWDLSEFGNTIPNINAEVMSSGQISGPIRQVATMAKDPPWPGAAIPSEGDSPRITKWATDWKLDPTLTEPTTENVNLITKAWKDDTFDMAAYYVKIGTYVRSDGATRTLYGNENGYPLTYDNYTFPPITDQNIKVVIDEVDGLGNVINSHVEGPSWAQEVGIPDGTHITGACLSANGQRCFVFGNATSGSDPPDYWWEVVDGAITREGDIVPRLTGPEVPGDGVWGNSSVHTGWEAMIAENGGGFIWHYVGNVPIDPASQGSLIVWEFDGTDLIWGAEESIGGPITTGTDYGADPDVVTRPSLFITQPGYCGTIGGAQTALWTRLPTVSGGVPLSEIVADLSDRAGLDAADYDVTELTDIVAGYVVTQQQTARASLEPLRAAYFFDAVESDDQVVFRKRNGALVATIPDDDLAARLDGSAAPPLLATTRLQEVDLPATVAVDYVNAWADYQTGTQYARRLTGDSESEVTLQLPISLSDDEGKAIADSTLFGAWLERERMAFRTTREYSKLEPCDIVSVRSRALRITARKETAGGVLEFEAVPHLAAVYVQGGSGVQGDGFAPSTGSVSGRPLTEVRLLDIPYLPTGGSDAVFYAAMGPVTDTTWPGASLQKSPDGTSYSEIATSATQDTIGAALTALGTWQGTDMVDELHTLSVEIHGGGDLASTTLAGMLNGANEALLGSEIIQYRDATLTGTNTYTLRGLIRGKRGTEWAINTHAIGEAFVVLPAAVSCAASEYGLARSYKAVTYGRTLADTAAQTWTNRGVIRVPYAPVHLGQGINGSGDITLTWTRRSRTGHGWNDHADVPLGETSESYEVKVYSDASYGTVLYTTTVATASCTVTAAQQTTLFGSPQSSLYWAVAQVGTYATGRDTLGNAPSLVSAPDPVPPPIPTGVPAIGVQWHADFRFTGTLKNWHKNANWLFINFGSSWGYAYLVNASQWGLSTLFSDFETRADTLYGATVRAQIVNTFIYGSSPYMPDGMLVPWGVQIGIEPAVLYSTTPAVTIPLPYPNDGN